LNVFSALSLVSFVASISLGIFVLGIDPRSRRNQVFCLLTLSGAWWSLGYVFMHSAPDEAFYRQWLNLDSFGWILAPVLVLHFFVLLSRPPEIMRRRWFFWAIYLPALPFLWRALTATSPLGTTVAGSPLGWIEVPAFGSPWLLSYTAYAIGYVLWALLLCRLWIERPSTGGRERRQAAIVLASGLTTLIALLVVKVLLPLFMSLPDVSAPLVMIWVVGVGYAVIREEFMLLTPATAAEGILGTMSDPVLLIDGDGLTLRANQATLDLLGRPEGDVVGRPWQSIFVDEEGMDLPGLLAGPLSKGPVRDVEMGLRARAGGVVPVMVSFSRVRNAEGRPLGVVAVCHDISERKRAEVALKESEERYRALYTDIPSMYFTIDAAGTVLSVNPFGASQLGYSVDELVGGSVLQVFPPDQQADATAHVTKCLAHPGQVFVWELRKVRKDGSKLDVRETARAVSDQRGALIVLIVCEDITERNALQEQLTAAQKMEAIGLLAGGVAHDFNNALTAIRGFAELHLADHPPGDAGRADVLEIEHAAERASQLTRGLLSFSRRAEVNPTLLDLAAVASDSVALLRRLVGEHIVVRLEASPGAPHVFADRVQIEQVLLNLAANARDAMPAGGVLSIAVTSVVLSDTYVEVHPGAHVGRHALLGVSDTGVGMNETTQARIFEPFFTTKPLGEGTGLGLASVYGIVKQAGGWIDVESNLGGGSLFRVYLPALEGALPDVPVESASIQSFGAATETILLVEDETAVRVFAQRVLQERGYHVLAFADPGVALQAAMSDPDAYDALVTDVMMPTMNGPVLAERIASVRKGLPVLFMSGYNAGTLPTDTPPPLAKPFSARDLAAAVGSLFGRID
jgi:PAS domain S-box-containing protein